MLDWDEIVQNYIIKHSDKIKRVTSPLRDHLGISYFTYHRIDKEGKYTVLVDRPDWAEHYVEEKYYLDDPYLREMSVYKSGFCFVEDHGSKEHNDRVLKAGKEIFDLNATVILIDRQAEYVEFFGFSGKKETSSLDKLYLNHPELLKSFCDHFKKELKPVLLKMESEAGPLELLKGDDFHCQMPIHPSIEEQSYFSFLKGIGKQQDVLKAQLLSRREKECLKLLIRGHSAKQTALVLKLSPRTIESYFENLKAKLSCFSKQELFALAKRLNEVGLL